MNILLNIVISMLGVGAMFALFGFLRPAEECGGHCGMCTSGCGTKPAESNE